MQIAPIKNIDVQTIGDVDSVQAGINNESLPFLFEMMSKSLYSNPIGSIVREITSNCFDSHVEANIELPVVIRKNYDADEGYSISFIDFGVGLSPDRIRKVYMNYFSSTKRDTNDLIGGFGLGSKTPLSYADFFYIITRYDGIEYQYILHKGEQMPTLDLLSEAPTTERNGTEIKIPFDNNDEYKFCEELNKQLSYFENVYIEGFGIDNTYKIYNGKLFKYRNKNQYSKEMHIILGRVAYPINWTEIGMKAVNIPVGVKFEIGELVVTPSREALRYTDEVKKSVKTRVEDTIKELLSLLNREKVEFESMVEYLENRNSRPHIKFEDGDKLYIPVEYGGTAHYSYKPVANYPGFTIPADPFFEYKIENLLNAGKLEHKIRYVLTEMQIRSNRLVFSESFNPNTFKNVFIGNALIVKPMRQLSFESICNMFGLNCASYGNSFSITKPRYGHTNACPPLGRAKVIYEYRKAIRAEVLSHCELNYDELVVSPDWIANYKRQTKESSLAYQRRIAQRFPVRDIIRDCNTDMSVKEAENFKGITIYGFLEDKDNLNSVKRFLSERKTLTVKTDYEGFELNTKAVRILRIARTNAHHFYNLKTACYVKDFVSDNRIFKDIATAAYLDNIPFIKNWDRSLTAKIAKVNKEVAATIQEIEGFVDKNTVNIQYQRDRYSYNQRKGQELYEDFIAIAQEHKLFNYDILAKVEKVKKWYNGVELLEYINFSEDEVIPHVVDYLKFKKKKINKEFFIKESPYTLPITQMFQPIEAGDGSISAESYEALQFPIVPNDVSLHSLVEEPFINLEIVEYE